MNDVIALLGILIPIEVIGLNGFGKTFNILNSFEIIDSLCKYWLHPDVS